MSLVFPAPSRTHGTRLVLSDSQQHMREVITRKMELMKLSLPGEFLFLFRIRFGLMSVLAKLGTRANWYRLERACIGR